MKLSDIVSVLENAIPLSYQEEYDNSGLIIGEPGMNITASVLCIDVTEEIIDEALNLKANLIISHHPVIFSPIKRITGSNATERIISKAVRNHLAIYCMHTNADNVLTGVNKKICEKLGLMNYRILDPQKQGLKKLITYVPAAHAENVRNALFKAGAGNIGKYDSCSYNIQGKGTFRAGEGALPYVGEIGKLHFEDEIRIETIFPAAITKKLIDALLKIHPYEEVAYDIFPLDNFNDSVGPGMVGELGAPMEETSFLHTVKDTFKCPAIKHSHLLNKPVKKIAVCGGSGAFLLKKALFSGADVFLTADVKYHQYFEADNKILIVDIGHYESEQFTIEIFYDILNKNLPNFAIHFSTINTSPVYYL